MNPYRTNAYKPFLAPLVRRSFLSMLVSYYSKLTASSAMWIMIHIFTSLLIYGLCVGLIGLIYYLLS